ncbi:MAG TPA: metal-dependent hydrolase [Terriglobales bacterium]|nr:metal-dependent hydrolase [Terriglobales bacterium]
MEPLTHFLTGACISRAGLNRKTALATVTLVLAAEAPDLDVLAYFHGPVYGFAHHRGITHTLLGVPMMAALVLVVVWAVYRLRYRRRQPTNRPRWGLLFWFACIGGLSHILLDFTNNYGVRPFSPFYPRWYSWDIVFIIEPVLWGILLAGLVLPALFGLIHEEIGVKKGRPRGQVGAILALAGMLAVWGVRDFEHRHALAAMQARLYDGAVPLHLSAFPYWVNPFKWMGVVETRNFFQTMHVDALAPDVDPDNEAKTYYKPEETPVTVAAKKSYLGRVYLDWAQYPLTETEKLESPPGYMVRFFDLRFMYPERRERPLSSRVVLNDRLQVVGEYMGLRRQPSRRDSSPGSK